MGEFSSPAMVLGSVRGRRSFGVLPDGRLTGLFYTQPWLAGENRATCFHEGGIVVRLPSGRIVVQGAATREIGAEHGLQGCTCGFYAYYRGDPYATSRRVSGVVEGYGRVVLGTKGFRAQKARLLALLLPDDPPEPGEVPEDAWYHADDPAARVPLQDLPAMPDAELTQVDHARIRCQYPDVALFTREAAMLAEFPPTEHGPSL